MKQQPGVEVAKGKTESLVKKQYLPPYKLAMRAYQ